MTQPAGQRENQHYVPKMLLRNFSIKEDAKRGKERVHVLDKSNSKAFISNIRNVAAAFDFYETDVAGHAINAEAMLSELEEHASGALQTVLATETVSALSAEQRMWLCFFCSVQFVRTQTVRDRIVAMNGGIERHIRRMGYDPAEVEGYRQMSEDDVKAMAIAWMANGLREYPKYFNHKSWFLMRAGGTLDYMIGDHPVVLHNHRQFGPYGNLGLAVPGVQIYLPITPRLALAIWCPSMIKEINDGWREPCETVAKLQQMQAQRPTAMAHLASQIADLEKEIGSKKAFSDRLLATATSGGCIVTDDDNTTMINSLQVQNASRFVMSQSGNFSLAERMFTDNAAFRSRAGDGLRVD